MIPLLGYAASVGLAFRLMVGHFAYSYTMTSRGRARWNASPCFPLERQNGDQPPAWGGALWRAALLAPVWPIAPCALLARRPGRVAVRVLGKAIVYIVARVYRLVAGLTVGNERRAKKLEEAAKRDTDHRQRCRELGMPEQ